MDNGSFSMIFTGRNTSSCAVSSGLIKQLGADWFFYNKYLDWRDFLTDNIDEIGLRQEAFADIAEIPELATLCENGASMLADIDGLRRTKEDSKTPESMLYSIKELEIYIDFIKKMNELCLLVRNKVKSRTFKMFCELIIRTAASEEFISLAEGVAMMSRSIKEIRSITIGLNLDAALSPYEAGIIAINSDYFRSGEIFDKIMRLDSGKDGMTTLAPLSAAGRQLSPREKASIDTVIMVAINKIYGAELKNWKAMVRKYFNMNTDKYIRLLPELRFLSEGAKIIAQMKSMKLPLCRPTARPIREKAFEARGLVNPAVAAKLFEKNGNVSMVGNDITFDQNGMIYVLTGPNMGGKSVFLCAVGLAQLMFQIGLPVAAESITISPVDGIFTHFTTESASQVGKGRLGEECERMQKIFTEMSEYSLVLLDETMSGTASFEASLIAFEVLAGLSLFGCRGIYATHLHELAARVGDVNSRPDMRSKVDTLTAGMENGQRSFLIRRMKPDGQSYARDIAEKFGLSMNKIEELRRAKQKNAD